MLHVIISFNNNQHDFNLYKSHLAFICHFMCYLLICCLCWCFVTKLHQLPMLFPWNTTYKHIPSILISFFITIDHEWNISNNVHYKVIQIVDDIFNSPLWAFFGIVWENVQFLFYVFYFHNLHLSNVSHFFSEPLSLFLFSGIQWKNDWIIYFDHMYG